MGQRSGGATVSRQTLLLGLISVLGLAALANYLMGDAPPPKANAPASLSPPPSPSDLAPKAAAGRTVPQRPPNRIPQTQLRASNRRTLALPDGTFVDTLNNAVDAPPIADFWGPFDWSPIIGTERSSAGIDWYKHADGSYSTTQMVMRTDLGREAAMTRVAHPGPAPATTSPR